MFHVVLFQPEIPPNTGNIIRLCANTGAHLHLIHPLGFIPDDKRLQRAGLDYHDWVNIQQHANYPSFITTVKPKRIFACSTKGRILYSKINYQADDVLLFGPETRGLPSDLLASFFAENIIRIPMAPNNRSLNLSNAVAIVLYEAWRQQGFPGAT